MGNWIITSCLLGVFLMAPRYVAACSETTFVHGQILYALKDSSVRTVTRSIVIFAHASGSIYYAWSNQFGYYSLTIPACGEYRGRAYAKGLIFTPVTFTLPVADQKELTIDFVATAINAN